MKDFFEHIDDYMEGQMAVHDQEAFAAEMDTNESLRIAVSNYANAKKLSEGLLEMDMLETLNKLESDGLPIDINPASKNPNKHSMRNWFILIGMVMMLSFLALWLSNKNTSHLDKEEILASYIRPVDVDATKSIDTSGMNAFQKGKYFFALNRFDESETWLKQYSEQAEGKKVMSEVYYWLGAVHLEQWELKEAESAWSKSDKQEAKRNLDLLQNSDE